MGELHEMKQLLTAKDIAKQYSVTSRSVQNWQRESFPEISFDVNAKQPPEFWAKVCEGKAKKGSGVSRKKNKPVSIHPPAAPDKATPAPARSFPTFTQVRTFFFDALAVGVVVGHGFLIWQEAAELYGYIGAIGGLVVFFVVCLAVLLASDPAKNRTSEYALWFMLLVDAAAGRVHFEALARPSVPFSITVGFCIFICACSWVALLLYRDSKQD